MNPSFTLRRSIAVAIVLLVGLFGGHRGNAVVINPDGGFDNPAPFTQASEVTWQNRYPDGTSNSWFTRNEGHSWSNYGGYAGTGGASNFMKLGQVFAVPQIASNETAIQFSFDWTPGTGSTGNQLVMQYWLIGWKTNSAPSDGDFFWDFVPWNSAPSYGVSNLSGNATVYSLDGTSLVGSNVTGVAGVTSNYTATFGLPVPTLGDVDFVGIRFSSKGAPVAGHTLDNVILVAAPEPSVLALAGTGVLVVGLAGRLRRTQKRKA